MTEVELKAQITAALLGDSPDDLKIQDRLFEVYDALCPMLTGDQAGPKELAVIAQNSQAVAFALWDCTYMSAYARMGMGTSNVKNLGIRHPGAVKLLAVPPSEMMGRMIALTKQAGIHPTAVDRRQAVEALRQFSLVVPEAYDPSMEAAGDETSDPDDPLNPTEDTTPIIEDMPADEDDPLNPNAPASGDSEPDIIQTEAEAVSPENMTEADGEDHVAGFNEAIHGRDFRAILSKLMSAWSDLYSNHVNGLEKVDGFIVPGGAIRSDNNQEMVAGVLHNTRTTTTITPNPSMANAMWEEFNAAAKACGVDLVKTVADKQSDTQPFKYNPLLQKVLASGAANPEAFSKGWKVYSEALLKRLPELRKAIEQLAINKVGGASDREIYKAISPFVISMAVVNNKEGLGGQLRICCGNLNPTTATQVVNTFIQRMTARERSGGNTISMGKFAIENPVTYESGVAVMSFYYDKAAYFSVPDFLGQLLSTLEPGQFHPSTKSILVGRKLDNTMQVFNLEKGGWCTPIIAGSRSGKGVLTLNILANVMACGLPLFYLDGKPDMGSLLWKMCEEDGIQQPMVVDCIATKGVTTVDHKPFMAPYHQTQQMWNQSENACKALRDNCNTMAYLKMVAVTYLTQVYNKDVAGMPYGELFVVMDEVYKFSSVLGALGSSIKADLPSRGKAKDETEQAAQDIKDWVSNLLATYSSAGIGIFNNGIRVVSLSQKDAIGNYTSSGTEVLGDGVKDFLETVGLKGAGTARFYGRKDATQSRGMYSWQMTGSSASDIDSLSDLINSRRHFALSNGSPTIGRGDIFKPLLVLNENDSREYILQTTGKDPGVDGAFVGDMMNYVDKSYAAEFRRSVLGDPRLGASVGFRGAIQEMARVAQINASDLVGQSMNRASELAEKALRHFGVIGQPGINSVYDYICSTDVAHLWKITDIVSGNLRGSENGLEGGISVDLSSLDSNADEVIDLGMGMGAPAGEAAGASGASGEQARIEWEDLMGDSDSDQDSQGSPVGPGSRSPLGGQAAQAGDGRGWNPLENLSEPPIPPVQNPDIFDQSILSAGERVRESFADEAEAARALAESKKAAEAKPAVTWDKIPSELVESTEKNIFDAIPDGGDVLDVMAHLLVDDVQSGVCDPALAEAIARKQNLVELGYIDGYDFSGNVECIHQSDESEREPARMVPSQSRATEFYGKAGEFIRINSENTRNISSLTDANSIKCDSAGPGPLNMIQKVLLQSPRGAERYAKRMWHSVIDAVVDAGYKKANITRISLLGGQMYVNGKILLLDGVIGGRENVRLRDLVDFPYMLKQLPMLDELRIDDDMLRVAVMQYPQAENPFLAMFDSHRRLSVILVKRTNGTVKFDRAAIEQRAKMEYMQQMTSDAQVKNAVEADCKARSRMTWRDCTVSDKVWGWKLCKNSMGSARQMFLNKNKPKPGIAIMLGAAGLVGGAVGGAAWLVASGFKGIGKLFKTIKR